MSLLTICDGYDQHIYSPKMKNIEKFKYCICLEPNESNTQEAINLKKLSVSHKNNKHNITLLTTTKRQSKCHLHKTQPQDETNAVIKGHDIEKNIETDN